MKHSIATFKGKEFSLFATYVVIQNKVTEKILITFPESNYTSATLWRREKRKGVWFNTHTSAKFPVCETEIAFIHDVLNKFTKYYNSLTMKAVNLEVKR